jgi:ubiquinone/menaquinone biosynthesis C-methylase UbiE
MFETPAWKGSIEKGPEKGRGIDDYERFLAFKRNSLEGKVVLDLGAGPEARFARDMKEAGIKADVISMSPDYADEKQRKFLQPSRKEKIKAFVGGRLPESPLVVAGIAEQLPFGDESFDEVLSLFAVTTYSLENYPRWLPEAIRVLKDGGTFRVGPFRKAKLDLQSPSDPEYQIREMDKIKAFVDNLGLESEFVLEPETGQEVLILKKVQKEEN